MKLTLLIIAILTLSIAGCNWFWNQKPVCENGYDESVQGCKGMPPMPPPGISPKSDSSSD